MIIRECDLQKAVETLKAVVRNTSNANKKLNINTLKTSFRIAYVEMKVGRPLVYVSDGYICFINP